MTPGARIQAAIDLIDQIFMAWQSQKRIPADKMLDSYFRSHRYVGSKDRGMISELVYWVLRHKAALEWWLERTNQRLHGRAYVFAAIVLRKDYNPQSIQSIFKDSQFSPPPLDPDETRLVETAVRFNIEHPDMPMHARLNFPEWMESYLKESFGDNI